MNTVIALVLTALLSSSAPIGNLFTTKTSSKIASSRKLSNSNTSVDNVNTQAHMLLTKAPQLNPQVLKLALTAYNHAEKEGDVKKPVLTVIDYSLPSNKQRMWIFDVQNDKLLYNTYVAHGKNSGGTVAKRFSNADSSKESSLGTYITQNTYIGHRGYSLNIKGLDKGFNDHALSRRVVVHGAWYVDASFIQKAGRAGNSWGCPAIAPNMVKPVINTIKNGTVIFAYYPDQNFLSHSGYLAA